jgi:hypothetical protein
MLGRCVALALACDAAACDEGDDAPIRPDVAIVEPQIQLSFVGADGTLTIQFAIELQFTEDGRTSSGITTRMMHIKTADGSDTIISGFQEPATTELSVEPGETVVTPFDFEFGYSGVGISTPADAPLCKRAPVVVSVEYTIGGEQGEVQSDPITPTGC